MIDLDRVQDEWLDISDVEDEQDCLAHADVQPLDLRVVHHALGPEVRALHLIYAAPRVYI